MPPSNDPLNPSNSSERSVALPTAAASASRTRFGTNEAKAEARLPRHMDGARVLSRCPRSGSGHWVSKGSTKIGGK